MPHVEVLIGSKSDEDFVWQADELFNKLEQAGVSYAVSVCSAHRNADDLAKRIDETLSTTAAYICCAGWAAALPGATKALLLGRSLATVYGIALPSEAYPDGKDAEISITRLPPGIDVVYGGVGTEALNDIADAVVKQALGYDTTPNLEELQAVRDRIKPPQFDVPRPQKELT